MALNKDRIQKFCKNWPFDDPRYVCRVKTVTKDVILEDGTKITRSYTKHNIPIGTLPEYAAREIIQRPPVMFQEPSMKHTNSPYSKGRRNRKTHTLVRKWIRPKWKLLWTKRAVAMIKDGLMSSLINPVSHKIVRSYLKVVPILPPIPQTISK